jgi:molybdopterin converting factor small subunit
LAVILIPSSLRRYSDQQSRLSVSARTIAEALARFAERSQDLQNHLFAGKTLRNFVVVSKNGKDIRLLNGMETPIEDADEVQIIASVAGG